MHPGHAGKYFLVEQEAAADFLDGVLELDADHQATATDFLDAGQFEQFADEVVADLLRVVHQMLRFHDVEHGDGSGAGQMVAAEGRAEHPVRRFEHGAYQDRAHREAVGDALGHGDDVRTDAGVLVGEELPATAVAGLDFVENQHRFVLGAERAEVAHELVRRQLDAAHALDALDDDRRDAALAEFGFDGEGVVEREVSNIQSLIDRGDDARVIRYADSRRGAPVEGMLEGEDALLAVVERRELEGVLVRLGTGVDQEQGVVVVARSLAEAVGELLLERVNHRVGVKAQLADLLADGLHVGRMAMSYGDDGMAAVEVEVLGAVGVPDVAALALDNLYIE